MKFFRIIFFYGLYFILCMIVVTAALQEWSAGAQMLFAFGVPVLLVWWQEKRRSRKTAAKALAKTGDEQKAPSRSRNGGWVPSSETASVAGRDIGGMVYVGTPPLLNTYGYRDKCRAYIDPSLSVARTGTDKAGDGMPYWPGYSDISPQCRATYLGWLARGRADASYNPGYMFLYFYGLERRFFVDQSNADAQDIVDEVRRLCSLYPDNHSVRRYLGEFLDIAMLAETEFEALEPVFERQGWELPFSLKYAIGARLDKGEQLGADWVCLPFISSGVHQERRPVRRHW